MLMQSRLDGNDPAQSFHRRIMMNIKPVLATSSLMSFDRSSPRDGTEPTHPDALPSNCRRSEIDL